MKELKNRQTGYKGITLLQFLDHLTDTHPADSEERDTIKKSITKPWDPTQHIGYLFNHITKGLETLADMQGNVTYTGEEWIETTYMVIRKMRQFDKDCTRWKRLPVNQRNTEQCMRTYFLEKYEVFDAQRDSLHDTGIANQATEFQDKLQKLEQELATERAANAGMIQMIDTAMAQAAVQDDASMISQMTTMTAMHKKKMEEMHNPMLAGQPYYGSAAGNPPPPFAPATPSGNTKTTSGSTITTGTSTQQQQQYQQQQQQQQRRIRGGDRGDSYRQPKTSKYYKTSKNVCWTHGYNVATHNSANCCNKEPGHVDTQTGENPVAGTNARDKEFSTHKDMSIPGA